MEFKEELKRIIHEIGILNPELEIATTGKGRFGGVVISDSFIGKSQLERQSMLWNELDRRLDDKKRFKIIGLLTMTRAEIEDADSFLDDSIELLDDISSFLKEKLRQELKAKSIRDVMDIDEARLKKIQGIGPKKAKAIKEAIDDYVS